MALPDWLAPMAATLTQDRFATPDWIFERKFDGIRVIAFKRGADVRLYSRNRLPWHLPAIADAIAALPIADAILDGEVTHESGITYHIFDAMWLDGRDVTALPIEERRALLAGLDLRAPLEHVRLLEHEQPWELARAEGWEGVIAKRKGTPYEHKRSKHWLKMKCELEHDFVVGGFTDPQGTRVGAWCSARRFLRKRRLRVCRKDRHRIRHQAAPGVAREARPARDPGAAVHEVRRPAAPARALGASRDRRPGRLHRVDHEPEASPSSLAERP
jgi:ATP-dependent DNA ligase